MINLHLDVDIRTLPEAKAQKKIDDINFIAGHFADIRHFDQCSYCADNAFKMSEAIDYTKGIADAEYNLGMISYEKGDYTNAIARFLKASKLYNSLQMFHKEADAYSYLGIAYRNIDDYSAMIDVFFKSLYIYRKNGEEGKEGNMLNSIGNYYLEVRQEKLALEYYAMSLKMKRGQKDIKGLILTLYNIGLIYHNINENEKALRYYETAFVFNEKIEKNSFYEHRILQNIGSVYVRMYRFNEAEETYLKCIDYFEKNDFPIEKADTLNYMAALYRVMKKYDKVEEYLNEGLKMAAELKSKRLEMLLSRSFAEYYIDVNNYRSALKYTRIHHKLDMERNKTIEEESIRKLNILHTVDITKKETQILSEKNEQLKSLNEELVRLNNEKNYFLNIAANDLKLPLENINEKINNIRRSDGEEKLNPLREILEESSLMQKIIGDLLIINETKASN